MSWTALHTCYTEMAITNPACCVVHIFTPCSLYWQIWWRNCTQHIVHCRLNIQYSHTNAPPTNNLNLSSSPPPTFSLTPIIHQPIFPHFHTQPTSSPNMPPNPCYLPRPASSITGSFTFSLHGLWGDIVWLYNFFVNANNWANCMFHLFHFFFCIN